MKFLILVISLLSINAKADSLHPDTFARRAHLDKANIAPGHIVTETQGTIRSGTIFVNDENNTVTLMVNSTYCPQVHLMPPCKVNVVREVTLPIVKVIQEKGCSGTTYIAKKDMRPVDGNFEQIVVTDRSTMLCELYIPENLMTRVTYKTITSGMSGTVSTYRSKFSGYILK